jgi:2-methylcitrate dehydratase PrpD
MTAPVSQAIAAHVAAARFENLTPAAVTAAKRSLLDAVGVMLAASGLGEDCDAFVELAEPGPCAILGHGRGASVLTAALANGSLAHALDYEDALDGAPIHPNAAIVPAALAVAQHLGGVSGERLLTALAVGCDLTCRLGMALTTNPDDHGWYPPPILGAQGAAAAAAVLLGLDASQTVQAFALALGPSAMTAEFKRTPDSTLRAVRDAFATHAGVLGALLAARDVRAFDQPFEGQAGLFAQFSRSPFRAEVLLDGLGHRWWGEEVSFKPWPSCRGTHAAIEAALRLRADVNPSDVQAIRLTGGPVQRMLAEPRVEKQAPATAIDAKFSLPFTVGLALAHGAVTLDSFETLDDPSALAVARLVGFRVGDGLTMADATGIVLEATIAGEVRTYDVPVPLGHPSRPLDAAAMLAKFDDCARRARNPARAGLADAILRLESLGDLDRDFFPLLA